MDGWRDESGLIVSWVVRLVLGFVLMGVVLYDAGSIAVNFFTLDATADEIATDISADTVVEQSFFNQTELETKARALTKEAGARLVHFEVLRDGSVELTIRRKAGTLIVSHVGAIENWARATAEATIANTD